MGRLCTYLDLFLKLGSLGDLNDYNMLYHFIMSEIPSEIIVSEDQNLIKEFARRFTINGEFHPEIRRLKSGKKPVLSQVTVFISEVTFEGRTLCYSSFYQKLLSAKKRYLPDDSMQVTEIGASIR